MNKRWSVLLRTMFFLTCITCFSVKSFPEFDAETGDAYLRGGVHTGAVFGLGHAILNCPLLAPQHPMLFLLYAGANVGCYALCGGGVAITCLALQEGVAMAKDRAKYRLEKVRQLKSAIAESGVLETVKNQWNKSSEKKSALPVLIIRALSKRPMV